MTRMQPTSETLSAKQQAIPLIASFMAASDMPKLNAALNQGLDAGLTISETKEVLVQLYAYVGFPRSLNALGELMNVVVARKQRGIQDAPGREPSRAVPTGDKLLAVGTANQTRISGAPVKGPVFDFAPVINQFLQAHLFRRHLRARQPRLAKPRVGHRRRVGGHARRGAAIAIAHGRQHAGGPDACAIASVDAIVGRTRRGRCRQACKRSSDAGACCDEWIEIGTSCSRPLHNAAGADMMRDRDEQVYRPTAVGCLRTQ